METEKKGQEISCQDKISSDKRVYDLETKEEIFPDRRDRPYRLQGARCGK